MPSCICVVCFAGNIQVNVPVSLNSTLEVVGKSVEQGEVTIQNKIEMKSDELVKVSGELELFYRPTCVQLKNFLA